MTDDQRGPTEIAEALLEQIDNHSDWDHHPKQGIQDVAASVTEIGSSSMRYLHTDADCSLQAEIATPGAWSQSFLSGTLTQMLDEDVPITPNKEYHSFFYELAETQQAIGEKYANTEYLKTPDHARNADILIVDVPLTYDQETLEQSIQQLSNAAEEVQELHDGLSDLVQEYRE